MPAQENEAEKKPAEVKKSIPKKNSVWQVIKQYAIITVGCIIYSLGISLFIKPAGLAAGGMTGISLILEKFIPLDNGILLIILNIPMVILGWIFFGWRFVVSTGYAYLLSSLLMTVWTQVFGENGLDCLPFVGSDILINSVVGGVLFGIGMGLIFRMGSSTAGTDVIIKLLRKKFRYIKTGVISFTTDMIIVACSLFIKPDLKTLFYTAVSVVVFTLIFDLVLYGGNTAKTVFIITDRDKSENIIQRVLKELNTGATTIDAEGAYTRENKVMIMCVLRNFNYPNLRDIVREEDKNAFMIVSSAKEIYGEGYKDQNEAEL